MAPRTKAEFLPSPDTIEVEPAEFYTEDFSEEKTDYEKKMDDLLNSLNEDDEAMVSIYRQRGSGKESMSFLDSFPVDKYSHAELLMFLKNKYGTGDYRAQVRVNGKIRANKLLSVESPLNEKTGDHEGNSLSGVSELLNTLMSRQDQLFQQMNKPRESEQDIIQKMMMYKELFAGSQTPQVNPMTQLGETLGLLEQMGVQIGGGDSDDGFGSLVDKLSPLINHAMSEPAQPQPQPQPQPQQNKQKAEIMMKMAQNIKIKMGLNFLLSAAKSGNNAQEYAQPVIDQVGEKDIEQLFGNAEYMNYLIKIVPGIDEHKTWFSTLSLEINKILGNTHEHGANKV